MSSGVAAQFDMVSATRFLEPHRTYRLALVAPLESVWEENFMATVETPSVIPADEMADMEEVCRLISEGKPVTDPALRKRIHERAEQVRRRDAREVRDDQHRRRSDPGGARRGMKYVLDASVGIKWVMDENHSESPSSVSRLSSLARTATIVSWSLR